MIKLILIVLASITIQGCALFMPYSEKFSCEMGIGEGYCGSVSDGYEYSIKKSNMR